MNKIVSFQDDGVHFTLFQSELGAVNTVASELYGKGISELTIGRAARVLHSIVTASLLDAGTIVDTAATEPLVTTGEEDEAFEDVVGKLTRNLRHSITTIGRIVIDVIPNDDKGNIDAESIQTIEVLGQAHNPESN